MGLRQGREVPHTEGPGSSTHTSAQQGPSTGHGGLRHGKQKSDSEPRLRAGQSAVRKIQDGPPFSVSWISQLCLFLRPPHALRLRCLVWKASAVAHKGSRACLGSFIQTPHRPGLRMPPWEWTEITGEPWEDSQGRQESPLHEPKHNTQGCSGQGPA